METVLIIVVMFVMCMVLSSLGLGAYFVLGDSATMMVPSTTTTTKFAGGFLEGDGEDEDDEVTKTTKKAKTTTETPGLISYETDVDSRGHKEGGLFELGKHSLECDTGEVLNEFKLHFVNDSYIGGWGGVPIGEMQYKYKCATEFETDGSDPVEETTPKQLLCDHECGEEYLGNSTHLKRLKVQCPTDHVLSKLKLNTYDRNNNWKWEGDYTFACQAASSELSCSKKTTKAVPKTWSLKNLKDSHVKCDVGQGIGSLELKESSSGNVFYEYTCCKPKKKK